MVYALHKSPESVLPRARGRALIDAYGPARTMQLAGGERGRLDRSRRRPADGPAARTAPNGASNLQRQLFGETPNRATGTVALPFPTARYGLARMFHTGFLRIGGTGYQPVLVGNLPTRRGRAPCRDEEMGRETFEVALPPGRLPVPPNGCEIFGLGVCRTQPRDHRCGRKPVNLDHFVA